MNNLISWGQSSEADVSLLEGRLGFLLPVDYRSFLISTNGGRAGDEVFFVEIIEQNIRMDVFYGVTHPNKVLTIAYWMDEFEDELQGDTLIIGTDPGGGMITYITAGEDKGIYYWDHAHFLKGSNEEDGNTYFVANSFTEFCDSLRDYTPA